MNTDQKRSTFPLAFTNGIRGLRWRSHLGQIGSMAKFLTQERHSKQALHVLYVLTLMRGGITRAEQSRQAVAARRARRQEQSSSPPPPKHVHACRTDSQFPLALLPTSACILPCHRISGAGVLQAQYPEMHAVSLSLNIPLKTRKLQVG